MPQWLHQFVENHVCKTGKKLKLQILFGSNFQFRFKRYVTDVPFVVHSEGAAARVSCFFDKQNQSVELLYLYFRSLADSANKSCVSSKSRVLIAMKGI